MISFKCDVCGDEIQEERVMYLSIMSRIKEFYHGPQNSRKETRIAHVCSTCISMVKNTLVNLGWNEGKELNNDS